MLLRAILIDDEETGIETLKLLIKKHISELNVVGEATVARKGIELIENFKPEIVFLDINMPEMNGFELLDKLRWRSFNLIFTTAYQEYGLKALKQDAMDYLLKPVGHRDLRIAIDRVKQRMSEQQEDLRRFEYVSLNNLSKYYTGRLAIHSKKGVEYIDPNEILFFESRSHYTMVYLQDEEVIHTTRTLRDFETQLCANLNFMRVHHSFIINLHKVTRYLKEEDRIVMLNLQKIPVSKSRRASFMQWMAV
jgi:two-component system, LytTR family, response regulator